MTKNYKGIFFLIVAALLLTGCPDPNKNGDSPAVAGPTKQGIAFSDNKLEITFDKELKAFDASGITVTLDDNAITEGKTNDYTLKVSDKKLVMTFKTNPIANQKYKVSLKAGAVTGKDGGTTKKEDSAETTFGVPPAFQSMAFSSEKKLELTFDKTLDKASVSASQASKVTITRAGTALKNTDYTLGIDVAKLVITFDVSPKANEVYTVVLKEGAVKSNKISSLAVSPAKEITFGVTPPPAYTGIARNNNKIELSFSKNLVTEANVSPNPTHITVTRAGKALVNKTDYILSIAGKKLVITLKFKTLPTIAGNYTVALRGKAVKSVDGKFSEAVKSNPTITMYNLPDIVGAPVFETGSATELLVTFNTGLARIDTGSFTVQSKADAAAKDSTYKSVSTSSIEEAKDKKQVELTLKTAATEPKMYRVVVAIGGVTATLGGVSNIAKRESAGVAYSTKPALADTPYIVGKKLVATFNMNIDLVKAANVKVYKGSGAGTNVTGTSAIVPSATKTLLEVTLPADDTSAADDVYRLKLLADAVSKEGDDKNKNAPATSSDITILAAPALDGTQDPYMVGRKIYVTFNKAIEYVDSDKIKVKKKGTTGGFGDESKPKATSVINPNNKKQLVITVNETSFTPRHFYRVHLEAGAIGGRNTALTAEIAPTDKDIQVTAGPVLTGITPVFSSTTELSITLPAGMQLFPPADLGTIKVQKKPDGGAFTTETNRTIAIDGDNSNKVNITLNNAATLYTPTWKVIFPIGSVRDAERNGNANEQATAEGTYRLSDIYSWKEVLASGTPENDNRWTARYNHTSVVFKDKIWVMGGYDLEYLNDVWSSVDGSTWTNESKKLLNIPDPDDENKKKYTDLRAAVAGKALWPARENHTSVVFPATGPGSKIWVMGGKPYSGYLNDVWSSTDGITWAKSPPPTTLATQIWSARAEHASVVFGSKIWVMGGFNLEYLNDVWSSTDGITWDKIDVTPTTGKRWSGTYRHEAVVANNKIWVMGGSIDKQRRKNVWYSANGADWTEATRLFSTSEFISDTSTALFKSRIWAMGGSRDKPIVTGGKTNKIFSLAESADNTTTWVTEQDANWLARYSHTSVVFGDKIWVLGGAKGYRTYMNDVWSFGVQN